MNFTTKFFLRNSTLFLMFIKLGVLMPAYADIKVQNIVIGSGCSSVCINGECESTCDTDKTGKKQKEPLLETPFEHSDFSELFIDSFDATIQYAEKFSVVLTETVSLMDKISISQKGNQLFVSITGNYVSNQPGSILITLPRIDVLQLSGSTDVVLSGFNQSTEFKLETSGSSDLIGEANSFDRISMLMEGQSDMDFSSSNVHVVNATLSGQADAKLRFSEQGDQLIANVSGQSGIGYCGAPTLITEIKGSADIEKNSC